MSDVWRSDDRYIKAVGLANGDPKVVVCSVNLACFGAEEEAFPMLVAAADVKRVVVSMEKQYPSDKAMLSDESAKLSSPVILAYISSKFACSNSLGGESLRFVLPDTCACALRSKDFSRKIKCQRPCEDQVLVLPICLSDHWYVVVCASSNKEMVIMGRSGVRRTDEDYVILSWLNNGSSDDWTIAFRGDVQPSHDKVNCGVYLLWNLDQYLGILLLSLAGVDKPPSFKKLDSVSMFRASIAIELVWLAGLILEQKVPVALNSFIFFLRKKQGLTVNCCPVTVCPLYPRDM